MTNLRISEETDETPVRQDCRDGYPTIFSLWKFSISHSSSLIRVYLCLSAVPFIFSLHVIQRRPFRYQGIDQDVVRLAVLLRDGLKAADFFPIGKLTVLNLACGRADESGALAEALAPATIGFYLGIDLRPDAIEEAAARWVLPGGEIEFRCDDASATDKMRLLPPFDFIFIRHQNYWHDPKVWDRLLGNALARLKPDGVLACTSYFDREHEFLVASLRTRGAFLAANVRHPVSRPLPDAPGKSVDRHLAIFRQRQEIALQAGSAG